MTQHRSPAVTKANPPSDDSSQGSVAESGDVRAGAMDEEDKDKKKKGKAFVPLLKSKTKKKKGEKPEAKEEEEESGGGESKEEDPMLKNKKKDTAKKDGCGCPLKKKKKMDSLTPREMNDACWKNYEQRGTKKKGGKTVPNCVPKSGKSTMKKDSTWASGFKFDGKALCMNSQDLAATDIDKAKRKKNAQSQPRNKIMAGTRNT